MSGLLLIIALTAGPLLVGFALDAILDPSVRWWRWWYAPLAVSLPGVGVGIYRVVNPGDLSGIESWPALIIGFTIFFAFLTLVPMVLACVGVGLRRALVAVLDTWLK